MSAPAASPPAVGKLWLEAPDFAALDRLACRPEPFVLWPVGPKPLLAHWMDEAVRRNVVEVVVIAADRPHLVRAALAGGHYWSRAVRVLPVRPPETPADCQRADTLPDGPAPGPIGTPGELLAHWLALQHAWLAGRKAKEVSVDRLQPPGAWIGPHTRVHAKARLLAPCWIGARAEIGAGAVIGPNALVGERSVVEAGAIVREAAVLAESYVGPKVNLHRMIAAGGLLLDAARGTRVAITDRFILAPLGDGAASRPGWAERGVAGLCALVAAVWSIGSPGAPTTEFLPLGWTAPRLRTGTRGPLLVRRRRWFWAVVAGRLRLIGVLPRAEADLVHLPDDVRAVVVHAAPGAVSWADLHGVHRVDDPQEWLHAAYQAAELDPAVRGEIRRRLWSVLLTGGGA